MTSTVFLRTRGSSLNSGCPYFSVYKYSKQIVSWREEEVNYVSLLLEFRECYGVVRPSTGNEISSPERLATVRHA